MTLTEVIERLSEVADEIEIIEILEITVEDILERFDDKVEGKLESLCDLCNEFEDEIYKWEG